MCNAINTEHTDHTYAQIHDIRPILAEDCQVPLEKSEKKPNKEQIGKEHNYAYRDTLVLRSLNVCGLKSKLSCPEFIENCQNTDINFFQEVKTDELDEDYIKEMLLKYDLNVIFKHRLKISKHRSGGLAVIYKKGLECCIKAVESDLQVVQWITFTNDSTSILFGNCYFPPEGSKYCNENSFDLLNVELISKTIELNIDDTCLLGDFNAKTKTELDYIENTDLNTESFEDIYEIGNDVGATQDLNQFDISLTRVNRDVSPLNKAGRLLLETCKNQNLLILNGRVGYDRYQGDFTTKDKSTIDYVLMNPSLLVTTISFDIEQYDPLLSDIHKCVNIKLKFVNCLNQQTNTNHECVPNNVNLLQENSNEKQPKQRVKWDERTDELMQAALMNSGIEELNDLSGAVEVNDLLNIYNERMVSLYNECNILHESFANKNHNRSVKKNDNPWFDKECTDKRKKYNSARRKVNNTTHEDLVKASKEYKKAIKKAKAKYLAKKRTELKKAAKNPKEYWKLLDFKKKRDTIKAPLLDLANHFRELNVTHENDTIPENDPVDTIVIDDLGILDAPFTEEEVMKTISKLKNGKSPGEDLILNEFIKKSANTLLPFYTNLFNTVFETGEFPEAWTTGVIIPIFKKGDPTNPSNYRGITLLSTLGKVFTKLINDRLEKFAEAFGILKTNQAGFRKNNSTVDQLFVIQTLVDIFLKQNRRLYVAWIDYAKAFDMVWRSALWFKLTKSGISSKLVNIIKQLYENVKSKVFAHGKFSATFPSFAGVRQGESLSPFLFSIFINDLEEFLSKNGFDYLKISNNETYNFFTLMIVLYADDTAIIADSKENLQRGLNALISYCEMWKLQINTDKTKVTIFEKRKSKEPKPVFTLNNNPIEIVESFNYLGVVLSSNGSMKKCIDTALDKGRKAMFAILKKARILNLSPSTQIELFHNLVLPIVLYGAEIWAYEDLEKLDKFHLKFLRYVLKLNISTPIPMIYGETGEIPISIYAKSRMVGYLSKMLNQNTRTLSKQVFELAYKMHKDGYYTCKWMYKVVGILTEMNRLEIIDNKIFVPSNVLTQVYKTYAREKFIDSWKTRLVNLTKCDLYQLYKVSFEQEKYLSVLPPNLATVLCKYRTSNHKLEVETGRHVRPIVPRFDRKCRKCELNETGNELHHLLVCPKYGTLRTRLIPRKYTIRINLNNFLNLMSCKNKQVMVNLARFIHESLKCH